MRVGRGVFLLLVGLALAGGGCRAPVTLLREGTPPPVLTKPAALAAVSPTRIEPDYNTLPKAEANPTPRMEFTYRGLDEKTAQCLAAANASIANLLDRENAGVSVVGSVKRKGTVNLAGDDLLREARRLTAVADRNRAAMEALERFLQLADVQGKAELYEAAIENFNRLIVEAPRIRAAQLPAPARDELMLQRATLLAGRESLDAGLALANHDLASKLGVSLSANEHFWPAGPFGMTADAIDADAAVKKALANRAELQLLRSLQERLNADTLASVRESLKLVSGLAGAPKPPAALSFFAKLKCLCGDSQSSALEQSEVLSRQKQIAELLTSKEQEVTAQVKNTAEQMAVASRRVAILRQKAESIGTELTKAQAAQKLGDVLTLESDHLKARAEVLAAVFEWHTWRVRYKAAQGLLGSECFEAELPPTPSLPPPARIPVKVQHSPRLAHPVR